MGEKSMISGGRRKSDQFVSRLLIGVCGLLVPALVGNGLLVWSNQRVLVERLSGIKERLESVAQRQDEQAGDLLDLERRLYRSGIHGLMAPSRDVPDEFLPIIDGKKQ